MTEARLEPRADAVLLGVAIRVASRSSRSRESGDGLGSVEGRARVGAERIGRAVGGEGGDRRRLPRVFGHPSTGRRRRGRAGSPAVGQGLHAARPARPCSHRRRSARFGVARVTARRERRRRHQCPEERSPPRPCRRFVVTMACPDAWSNDQARSRSAAFGARRPRSAGRCQRAQHLSIPGSAAPLHILTPPRITVDPLADRRHERCVDGLRRRRKAARLKGSTMSSARLPPWFSSLLLAPFACWRCFQLLRRSRAPGPRDVEGADGAITRTASTHDGRR